MMLESWTCKKHEQQKISFICTGNVWHFQPLCSACLPDHTKNHPKNIKVQLENVKDVLPKAIDIKKQVSGKFEERLKRCNALSEIKDSEWAYIKSLNQRRQSIIKEVHTFFDSLIAETRKRRIQEEHIQYQNLSKMREEIKEKITFFQKEDYSDIVSFCNQIKKYYFKDDTKIYVEQIDEVFDDYEEKIIRYDPFVWSKEIPLKIKKMIMECYKVQDQVDKSVKQKIDTKKQPKKKEPVRKKCPTCKEQMQYLTEWKKHLVCRNCGNKERNYTKKI